MSRSRWLVGLLAAGLFTTCAGSAEDGARLEEPVTVESTDADIIWLFDMIDETGAFPHNVTSSSVCIYGDILLASTSNGVDYGHVDMPQPNAPCLIMLDKNTGELLGEEASGLGDRTFHASKSSEHGQHICDVDAPVRRTGRGLAEVCDRVSVACRRERQGRREIRFHSRVAHVHDGLNAVTPAGDDELVKDMYQADMAPVLEVRRTPKRHSCERR